MKTLVVFLLILQFSGCIMWSSGLKPKYPSGRKFIPSKVDSLQPLLSWRQWSYVRSRNIRYELQIMTRPKEGGDLYTVYSKTNLKTNSHQVESILAPGRLYYWRVRPVYEEANETVTGRWNGYKVVYYAIFFYGILKNHYKFNTPQ